MRDDGKHNNNNNNNNNNMTKETLLRLFAVLLAVAGGEVEVTEETETVECTEQSIGATTYKQECMYIYIIIDILYIIARSNIVNQLYIYYDDVPVCY